MSFLKQNDINPDLPSTSLDDFVNEMSIPKELKVLDENAAFDQLEDEEQAEEKQETPTLKAGALLANSAAKTTALALDMYVPMGLGMLAGGKADPKLFKADPEEKKELERAFAEYYKQAGVPDMPPWVTLALVVIGIYGTKIPQALALRKKVETESHSI